VLTASERGQVVVLLTLLTSVLVLINLATLNGSQRAFIRTQEVSVIAQRTGQRVHRLNILQTVLNSRQTYRPLRVGLIRLRTSLTAIPINRSLHTVRNRLADLSGLTKKIFQKEISLTLQTKRLKKPIIDLTILNLNNRQAFLWSMLIETRLADFTVIL
jgi:hypothetical protein